MSIKTGEIARRLDVHQNTVRNWADLYGDFLTPNATAARRRFTADDLRVLSTVSELRTQGLSFEQIREALAAGKRIEDVPGLPTPEEVEARRSVGLVPVSERDRALDEVKRRLEEIEMLKGQVSRLIAERDALLDKYSDEIRRLGSDHTGQVQALNARISALEREAGELRGKLESRPGVRFWLLVLAGVVAVAVVVVVIVLVVGR